MIKMTIISFSKEIGKTHPKLFDFVKNSYIFDLITYLIDSKKRRAVDLKDWLKEQVDNPSDKLKEIANNIPSSDDYDTQIEYITNWVIDKFEYIGDSLHWGTNEYWQTAEESITDMRGDCEDGAILIYILARLKGIPSNRLLIWCGNVKQSPTAPQGGHACLFYTPMCYPLNYTSQDWCYYPNKNTIPNRNLFTFNNKNIQEEWFTGSEWKDVDFSCYRSTWWLFNEEVAYSSYSRRNNQN